MTAVPGAATDCGLRRDTNEDRIYVDSANGVFLAVDGLGGHAAGDLAAEIAVDVISRELSVIEEDLPQQIRRSIASANNQIFRLAQENPDRAGMGCVLTLAIVRNGTVTVGHVGDSRLYLVWNGTVRKVTSDHSPVGEQEDLGELTESEAMLHPRRNEVFRDLGSQARSNDEKDFVEVKSFAWQPSAALVLCTDGLSDALTSAEIGAVVDTYDGNASAVAQALVEAAKDRGRRQYQRGLRTRAGLCGASAAQARTRHAITRMRKPQRRWTLKARQAVWLLVGMVLGIVLWQGAERLIGGIR